MEFDIPTDLSVLTDEALAEALAAARAEFATLAEVSDDEITDEQVARMEALGEFVTAGLATQTERTEALAARQERIAAARTSVPAEEPVVEPVVEQEPVVASATQTPRRRAAAAAGQAAPEPETPPATALVASLVAAADVPGFSTGQSLEDLDAVVAAAMARFQAMPSGKVGNTQNRYGVARIDKARTDDLRQENFSSDMDLLMAASKESRLPGGSLVAAGGWCSPSETMYDLLTTATTDGLIDLPEVQVNRGGIRFTKGPDFAALYAAIGFAQTEAQAIAATPKTFVDVECPTFDEVRLDAVGIGINAGILTNAAYPELIRWYIENGLIAHQHKVSARLIAAIKTITGVGTSVVNAFPNAVSVLTALELVIEGERENYRMARNATMEVILPFWVKSAIRADLANRNGVDFLGVTDAQVEGWFTQRGARAQYLYNHQSLGGGTVIDYPATVDILLYPAGSLVKGTKDVITLDAVYDSTNIRTNTYTALFAEEGVLLANVNHTPKRLIVPLSITGTTGAANRTADYGTAQV